MHYQQRHTPLHDAHCQADARMIDFAHWHMPLDYDSSIQEHLCVRNTCGMFDVSHMHLSDIKGQDALNFIRKIASCDANKLTKPADCIYGCLLNEQGYLIDDIIVSKRNEHGFTIISNAATTVVVDRHIQQHIQPFDASYHHLNQYAIIALQGPTALQTLCATRWLSTFEQKQLMACKPMSGIQTDQLLITRTGYTGEDGVEIIIDQNHATNLWHDLCRQQVHPCGLAARDTLRLEAGLNLSGTDFDEQTTPYACALGWTIDCSDTTRDFIGKQACLAHKANNTQRRIGLLLPSRGVLRSGQKIMANESCIGIITSGGFSPCLKKGIALARVAWPLPGHLTVQVHHKSCTVTAVQPPFIKNGNSCYQPITAQETLHED